MQTQFWVIGGDYSDRDFTAVIEGTEQVLGPFACRREATAVWWERSMAHRHQAMTRYTISTEPVAGAAVHRRELEAAL